MRDIPYTSSREELIEQEVVNITKIGDWANSCINLEQLKITEDFLDKYISDKKYTIEEIKVLHYHLGIVDGICLSLRNLKFKDL